MSIAHRIVWVLIGAVAFAGCQESRLRSVEQTLRIEPSTVDLGTVARKQKVEQTLLVFNLGKTPLKPIYSGLPSEFSVEAPEFLEAGQNEIHLSFSSTHSGPVEKEFNIQTEEGLEAVALVRVEVSVEEACVPSSPCMISEYNVETGKCQETPKDDGIECTPASLCQEKSICQAGRCIGTARSCDDGNACTLDVCNPNTGCEHVAAPPCPGDGKCQLGTCDPKIGCTLTTAEDGTLCGPTQTCDLADVCMAGKCVQRNPPDGYVCAPSSPCQSEGQCRGSKCERSAAVPLTPTWNFDSLLTPLTESGPELGSDYRELHDLVLEPNGSVSLMGFFAVPRLRANTAQALDGETPARRCIMWNSRLVCADYPYTTSGQVSGVDLATGNILWTHDLPQERPDLASQTAPGRMFLARLAALGPDRLAALFEAYPSGTNSNTQCRAYFLSVLNGAGQTISAQRIQNPFLDYCSHPHPYGVAADVYGNLYIAFSQSDVGVAPLFPRSPSLLQSFSRDGILRWERVENFVGGELAVAKGLIYPEKSDTAFVTSTGAPFTVGGLPSGTFGRVVATGDRVIPSPGYAERYLRGFELEAQGPSYAERWTHFESEGFASTQIRLASWFNSSTQADETVALVFANRRGQPNLVALGARHGQELWSCPMDYDSRSSPQLMEVANHTLALMEGSNTCGTCDPPFANSSAAFHTFRIPGLKIANEPWLGTFGGAGHDHLEDATPPQPPKPPVVP